MNTLANLSQQLGAEIQNATSRIADKLPNIREQITETRHELEWLNYAPLPLDEAVERINRYVDGHSGQLSGVDGFFRPDTKPQPLLQRGYNSLDIPAFVTGGALPRIVIESDLSGIVCSLMPDLVKQALTAQAEREAGSMEAGPPLAERPALTEAAENRLWQLETEEEALIYGAELQGIEYFARRDDCRPEIVFGAE